MSAAAVKLTLDGIVIVAYEHEMPKSGNPADCKCPMCGKRHERWEYEADITQYGFQWDGVTTILKCAQCNYRIAVRYEVAHRADKPQRKRVRK